MKKITMKIYLSILFVFVLTQFVAAQTTNFTYQGRFTDSTVAQPTSGTYNMQFALYDSGGTQSGATITNTTVQVTNGVFTVSLDFGANSFDGTARLLEIRVFSTTTNDYVILNPRQPITSTPYSIRALKAATADNALNVGGTPAADIITESDPRLTDPRTPTAGSASYIQNQNAAAQTAANFSIDGTGVANIFNATTQFNIGVNRVFSIGGSGNTFAGVGSGAANPTGNNNSFFGREAGFSTAAGVSNSFFGTFAGRANLGGNNNSFFGRDSGRNNETGVENSFFGVNAGFANTMGNQNVFLGVQAGNANTTGSNNTLVGTSANVTGGALTFATAIGSGATVGANNTVVLGRGVDTVQVPGNLTVVGTVTANLTNLNASNIATGTLDDGRLSANVATLSGTQTFTGAKTFSSASNSFTGSGAGLTNLSAGNVSTGTLSIARGGTGSTTQNFVDLTTAQTIAGAKTFSATLSGNVVNAAMQFNLGGSRVLINDTGLENLFVGISSGAAGVTGNSNAFFGSKSGNNTTTGIGNSFFGRSAGFTNVSGNNNSFFGQNAGILNTGDNNSFFGSGAGDSNTTGSGNLFFGVLAGNKNVVGSNNLFFGNLTGNENIGGSNSFFGAGAGISNTTGNDNVFLGINAGLYNINGSNNTMLGSNTTVNFGAGNLSYATAIGAGATVFSSNTIVLGRVGGLDKVRVHGLGAAGFTTLCRNNDNEIAGCSSSLRYKTNIAPFNFGLNLVKRLKPITFDWKDGGMHDLGLGAEDVAAIEPLLVTYNKDGQIEGVKYDRIGVVLLNAVKEQQTQIEAQRKQIEAQRLLIDGLKTLVCANNSTAAICQ